MNLDKVSIALRPRPKNLAMDLGFKLARRWFLPLVSIWLIYTAPLFLTLLIVFPEQAVWVAFGLWWLLPFFERPLCFYLSLAVFGHEPKLSHVLKKTPFLFSRQTLGWLTYQRLNFNRSFLSPIIILENLDRKRYRSRASILGASVGRAPSWLAFVCAHLAYAMAYGIMLFIYFLKPTNLPTDWEHVDFSNTDIRAQYDSVVGYLEGTEVFSVLGFYFALSVITPFFVAAGFSLYLNQRTRLEGWDIDIQFKRIRAKFAKVSVLLPLVLTFASFSTSPVWAQAALGQANTKSEPAVEAPNTVLELPIETTQGSASKVQLTAQQRAEREKIATLDRSLTLKQEEITRWRLKEQFRSDEKEQKTRSASPGLAFFIRVVIWVLGGLIVAYLAYHVYQYLLRQQFPLRKSKDPRFDAKILRKENVLADEREHTIADVLNCIQSGKPREALVALWSVFNSHMVRRYEIPLKANMTEQECYAMSRHYIRDPEWLAYMKSLLKIKLRACYSGTKVSRATTQEMIDAYLKLCEGRPEPAGQGSEKS